MLNKALPHNIEAERQVIGTVLCDFSTLDEVRGKVYSGDFYNTAHQKIWQAFIDLDETGERIDLLTVNEKLKQQRLLDQCGGPAYLSELTDNLITPSSIESAVKLVKWESHKRWLLEIARKCEEACFNGGDPSDIVFNFQKKLDLIKQEISLEDSGKKPLPTATLIIDQLKTDIKQNRERGSLGIDPGFKFLRSAIKALIPGHLWIIGGYTSHGKTALAVELISRVIFNSPCAHITLFSTEMNAEAYLLRLVANQTGVSSLNLLEGNYTLEVQKEVDKALEVISKKNLIIYDDVYQWERMAGIARGIKVNVGLDILFIDYIQNIIGKGTSIYERMSLLAPQIQSLGKELDCTTIVMSQISNEAMKNESDVLGYKGAGEIGAACDLGLWLDRGERGKDNYKINSEVLNVFIKKNRHGPLGKSKLKFINNFTALVED